MTISATIWLVIKWLLIIAAGSGLLLGLIALFHPLRFNLNLRGSLRGQRAELWFVYLFRIFKIGIIATPHTQDVVIKVFFWQRLLQRNQRQRPRPPATPPPDFPGPTKAYEQPPQTDIGTDSAAASKEKSEAELPAKADAAEEIARPVPPQAAPDTPTTGSQKSEAVVKDSEKPEPAAAEIEKPVATESEKKSSKPEPVTEEIGESGEEVVEPLSATVRITPDPQAQTVKEEEKISAIEDIDPFAEKSESEKKTTTDTEKSEAEAADTWQKRLRLLRKRIGEKYRLAKKWLRLIGRKYRLLSPIFWKFWGRSKKGFRIDHPALLCRYALHEPYLTGMFQGNLAIFSGLLQRFGIEFVPVPTFGAPTLYTRGKVSLVLLPWRFVFAVICLLFERILWTEAWRLFKWYRSTKTVSTP